MKRENIFWIALAIVAGVLLVTTVRPRKAIIPDPLPIAQETPQTPVPTYPCSGNKCP